MTVRHPIVKCHLTTAVLANDSSVDFRYACPEKNRIISDSVDNFDRWGDLDACDGRRSFGVVDI